LDHKITKKKKKKRNRNDSQSGESEVEIAAKNGSNKRKGGRNVSGTVPCGQRGRTKKKKTKEEEKSQRKEGAGQKGRAT